MRALYSVDIPVAYVTQFSTNVHLLSEQQHSRLINTVNREDVTGESWTVEITGGIPTPNEITERHGDTPLNNTPQTRRWGFIRDFDVADLIDKQDRVKMLIQVDSIYTRRHAGTMGRGMDDEIIRAAYASAVTGHTGTGSSAFPTSTQQLASGSTGMTIDKLNRAKEILDSNEVDEYDPRFCVLGARQLRELLEDDKITSADFNTVKALVQGQIDEFLGFKFVRSQRLGLVSAERNCLIYTQSAIRFGMAMAPNTIASQRPDKRYSQQIYTCGSWGALRTEDARVVSVLCSES